MVLGGTTLALREATSVSTSVALGKGFCLVSSS